MSDLDRKLVNFNNALQKLKQGINRYDGSDDLARDGLIKRYEFTFELSWKTLKAIFEEEGLLGLNSPKLVLKEAYSSGLIDNEAIWLDMLKDRNLTSHMYNEEVAIKISDNIRDIYVDEFTKLAIGLAKRIN